MRPILLTYEHDENGKLVDIHNSHWVPGMFRKNGKFFIRRNDPRKIDTEQNQIQLGKNRPENNSSLSLVGNSTSETQKTYTNPLRKARNRLKTKRIKTRKSKNAFSEQQIEASMAANRSTISMKDGIKKIWFEKPEVINTLRGVPFFCKKNKFDQVLYIPSRKYIYIWKTGTNPTTMDSPDNASVVVTF